MLGAAIAAVSSRPAFVLATGCAVLIGLAAGIPRLYYEVDFGDQSLVLRSVRFMEANFRKPMTTELVVTVPEGKRIYDEESLRLLRRLEEYFKGEPSSGVAWSFLDFLEEAYRIDHGRRANSFDDLVKAARGEMPIVASYDGLSAFWSESATQGEEGARIYQDRARVSVHRSWLNGEEQIPYVNRLREFIAEVNRDVEGEGYRVELNGGLELAALAEERIRELLSAGELTAEGRALRHCVASYASACASGACSIWTMELHGFEGVQKRQTIEVRGDLVVQCRGRFNKLPSEQEREILARWAQQEGLVIASYIRRQRL
jgi:hypothetical protein